MDHEYIQDWSFQDSLEFIKHVVEETEVTCQWVDNAAFCSNSVKWKDFKPHLHHIHGVTSETQVYQCRWHGCSSDPMKRSSLERHMKEQHSGAKWACPSCSLTFTRESTMVDHIRRTPGHV